jgi:hypothetical protein
LTGKFFDERTFSRASLAAHERDLAGTGAGLLQKPGEFSELKLAF